MHYRTRLYLAAEWDGDKDLIDQLHDWNNSEYYSLHFSDAHDLKQSYDWSLACTIKRSLADRMSGSKIFLLIVGAHTNSVTKGGCQYCSYYSSARKRCTKGHMVDYSSFIQYECEKAVKDGLSIIVVYNDKIVDRNKCPEAVRYLGEHIAAYHWVYSGYALRKVLNYQGIKRTINNAK
ncbi:MAG: TIR domain-containing protein [Clostridia bacterium]|nr:TIR domain-containing protein [Clostridia bacterium]